MKSTIRVLCFIAIAALIAFSFAACGDDDGGGNSGASLADTAWRRQAPGEMTTYLNFTTDTTVKWERDKVIKNGTYTFNGRTGTITWDNGKVESFKVNGDKLDIGVDTFTKWT